MKTKILWLCLCGLCIVLLSYWVAGYSIISNPSFLLERSVRHENLALQIIACKGLEPLNAPRIYILPKRTRKFFFVPYAYLHKRIGLEQKDASFTDVKSGNVVLQENATIEDFYHELGHFIDYSLNPDAYIKKSDRDKEIFAADFASEVRTKCPH